MSILPFSHNSLIRMDFALIHPTSRYRQAGILGLMKDPSILQDAPQITLLKSSGWQDYALLDSGNGRKLERFGACTIIRPEVQAMWQPAAPQSEWQKADAEFQTRSG